LNGSNRNWLIVGVGNEFRGDDAIGIDMVQRLQQHRLSAATYLIVQRDASSLIDQWEGKNIIVIDAVCSKNTKTGRIHLIDSFEKLTSYREKLYSTHGIGVVQAFELGKQLGRIPASFLVIGVEGENWGTGEQMSENVRNAIPEVEQMVWGYIDGKITHFT